MAGISLQLRPLLAVLLTALPIYLGLLCSAQRPSCDEFFASGTECLSLCNAHTKDCIRKVVYGASQDLSSIAEEFKESVAEYRQLRRLSPVEEQQEADDDASEDVEGAQPPASSADAQTPEATDEGQVDSLDQDTPEEPAVVAVDEPASTAPDSQEVVAESEKSASNVSAPDTPSDDSVLETDAESLEVTQDTPETSETVDAGTEDQPAGVESLEEIVDEAAPTKPEVVEPVDDALQETASEEDPAEAEVTESEQEQLSSVEQEESQSADSVNSVEETNKEPAGVLPPAETAEPVEDVLVSTDADDSSESDGLPHVDPEDLNTGLAIFQVISTPGYAAYANTIKEARKKKADSQASGVEITDGEDKDDAQFLDFSGIVDRVKQCVTNMILEKSPECVDQRLRDPRSAVADNVEEEEEETSEEVSVVEAAPTAEENVEQLESVKQPGETTAEAKPVVTQVGATEPAVPNEADTYDLEEEYDEMDQEEAQIPAEEYAALFDSLQLAQQQSQMPENISGSPVQLSHAEAMEVDAYIAELMDLDISDNSSEFAAPYTPSFWAENARQVNEGQTDAANFWAENESQQASEDQTPSIHDMPQDVEPFEDLITFESY